MRTIARFCFFILALLLIAGSGHQKAFADVNKTGIVRVSITAEELIFLVSKCKTNGSAKPYLEGKSFTLLKTNAGDYDDTTFVYKSNQPDGESTTKYFYTLVNFKTWDEYELHDTTYLTHTVEALVLWEPSYTAILNNFISLGFKRAENEDEMLSWGLIKENEKAYLSDMYPDIALVVETGITTDTKDPYFHFKLQHDKNK